MNALAAVFGSLSFWIGLSLGLLVVVLLMFLAVLRIRIVSQMMDEHEEQNE